MSEVLTIPAEPRDPAKNKGPGSRVARRLRAQKRVPAIIYGHKQTPQPISVHRDDVWTLIKKTAHLAQLQLGDATQMVLVRDIQWDHLGKDVLHMDFARVDAGEEVRAEVRVELHGTAPGIAEGGVLEFFQHNLPVLCRADAIPDVLRVEIGGVKLGEGIHVRDLTLPEGVRVDADPDLLVLHVIVRGAAEEETPAAAGPAEPEVIGRKAEDKEKED